MIKKVFYIGDGATELLVSKEWAKILFEVRSTDQDGLGKVIVVGVNPDQVLELMEFMVEALDEIKKSGGQAQDF